MALLSRVCAAGSRYSSGKRLSLIKAWRRRHCPSTTSTRSYTIRFSRPSTASRLRKPISESSTTTFLPCMASAVPRFAVVVVLPTPPFPDVIVITLLSIGISLKQLQFNCGRKKYGVRQSKQTAFFLYCHESTPHEGDIRE